MTQSPSDVPGIDDWSRLLDGKIAVVSGGGAGIGAAIARLFAEHGAVVEIAEVDEERARAVEADIRAMGGSAQGHVVDVRVDDEVSAFSETVLDTHGTIDVLVNNVGDYRPLVRFEDSDAASWQAMYDVNLRHLFAVTSRFVGAMIEGGGGSVVNVHSVEGMRGFPADPVYAAMKAGAVNFTRSFAVGYGRKGIRCNGIGPDLTQTDQVDVLGGSEPDEPLWASWAPVGRAGWPEDTARVALFLASDLSAYVTGVNVPVDGGTLSQSGWFFSPAARRFVNRPRSL